MTVLVSVAITFFQNDFNSFDRKYLGQLLFPQEFTANFAQKGIICFIEFKQQTHALTMFEKYAILYQLCLF